MLPRRVAAATLALAAIALALPTVAAPMTGTLADPVGDGVTLTTENSTNAEYVRSTDDGVVLDFTASNPALTGDGLNPTARTYVADTVRVRYDGDTAATVWLTSDAEGVTVLAGGAAVDSRANAVTLGPDESVPVGVVVDTTGEAPPATAEFTVRARVADEEELSSDEGDAATDPDDPVTTRVRAPDATTRILTLRNGVAGRPVTFDPARLEVARTGGGAVALDELSVVGDGGSLSLGVTAVAPGSAGTLPADASVRPLGAVEVEKRRGTVERATLRFGVDRAYLDATGLSIEDLVAYQYDGGGWSERGVDVVARGDEQVVLETTTPGLSTVVVAASAPELRVTNADLRTTTVASGDQAVVTAEVTNVGAKSGERTVTVTVDGDAVAQRPVELAPSGSTNVTVRVEPSAPGAYAVGVGSADAGRLVVEDVGADAGSDGGPDGDAGASSPETAAPGDASTETPVVEPAGGAPTETLWLVVAVVGVVVMLALVRRFGS